MSEATPRPWRHSTLMGRGPNDEAVFHCGMGMRGPAFVEEQVANAALIVRAVNCHDELVAALSNLIEEIETDGGVDTSEWPLLDEARAALARARGVSPQP